MFVLREGKIAAFKRKASSLIIQKVLVLNLISFDWPELCHMFFPKSHVAWEVALTDGSALESYHVHKAKSGVRFPCNSCMASGKGAVFFPTAQSENYYHKKREQVFGGKQQRYSPPLQIFWDPTMFFLLRGVPVQHVLFVFLLHLLM